MARTTHKALLRMVVFASMVGAVACVTARPAKPGEMIANNVQAAHPQPFSVSLSCDRGENIVRSIGTPGTGADISCASYLAALTASIQKSKLFSAVVPAAAGPDYELVVSLIYIDSPAGGTTNPIVTLKTNWKLRRRGAIVFAKDVASRGDAEFPNEFITWPTGNTLATERAGRENIEQGIRALGETDIARTRADRAEEKETLTRPEQLR
jgi:hypothetical protein